MSSEGLEKDECWAATASSHVSKHPIQHLIQSKGDHIRRLTDCCTIRCENMMPCCSLCRCRLVIERSKQADEVVKLGYEFRSLSRRPITAALFQSRLSRTTLISFPFLSSFNMHLAWQPILSTTCWDDEEVEYLSLAFSLTLFLRF